MQGGDVVRVVRGGRADGPVGRGAHRRIIAQRARAAVLAWEMSRMATVGMPERRRGRRVGPAVQLIWNDSRLGGRVRRDGGDHRAGADAARGLPARHPAPDRRARRRARAPPRRHPVAHRTRPRRPRRRVDAGRLRRAQRTPRRGPDPPHPARGLGRALRVTHRRQPPPRRLPRLRIDRRRRLRRRPHALPHRLQRPRLRDRRGRSDLLGHLPRLPDDAGAQAIESAPRRARATKLPSAPTPNPRRQARRPPPRPRPPPSHHEVPMYP